MFKSYSVAKIETIIETTKKNPNYSLEPLGQLTDFKKMYFKNITFNAKILKIFEITKKLLKV